MSKLTKFKLDRILGRKQYFWCSVFLYFGSIGSVLWSVFRPSSFLFFLASGFRLTEKSTYGPTRVEDLHQYTRAKGIKNHEGISPLLLRYHTISRHFLPNPKNISFPRRFEVWWWSSLPLLWPHGLVPLPSLPLFFDCLRWAALRPPAKESRPTRMRMVERNQAQALLRDRA